MHAITTGVGRDFVERMSVIFNRILKQNLKKKEKVQHALCARARSSIFAWRSGTVSQVQTGVLARIGQDKRGVKECPRLEVHQSYRSPI
jgi:hypothetical protein